MFGLGFRLGLGACSDLRMEFLAAGKYDLLNHSDGRAVLRGTADEGDLISGLEGVSWSSRKGAICGDRNSSFLKLEKDGE